MDCLCFGSNCTGYDWAAPVTSRNSRLRTGGSQSTLSNTLVNTEVNKNQLRVVTPPPISESGKPFIDDSFEFQSQASSAIGTAGLASSHPLNGQEFSTLSASSERSSRSLRFRERFSLKVSSSLSATQNPAKKLFEDENNEDTGHSLPCGRRIDISVIVVDVQENGDVEILRSAGKYFGNSNHYIAPKYQAHRGHKKSMKNTAFSNILCAVPAAVENVCEPDSGNLSPTQDTGGMLTKEGNRMRGVITPTKNSSYVLTPDSSPLGCKWTCGQEFWSTLAQPIPDKVQYSVEAAIEKFLGSPGTWYEGWHAWSMQMGTSENSTVIEPDDIRRVFRNRVGDLNARAKRIQKLKKNLSPFDHARANAYGNKARTSLKKSNSFPARRMHTQTSPPTAETSRSLISYVNSGFGSLTHCGELNDSKEVDSEDNDLCYDSDPGEGSNHCDGLGRNVDKFLRHGVWNENISSQSQRRYESCRPSESRATLHGNMKTNKAKQTDLCGVDQGAENHFSRVVMDTINKKMTLVWHRTPDGFDNGVAPMAVSAWIELGSQLQSKIIQPRLMWKPINDDENQGGLGVNHFNLHSVELLDVGHILEANRIDRKHYPLAKRNCSFFIEALDRTMLFEASCEEERNDIIDGLKHAVARLGSKIIVGDDTVFEEFFSPTGFLTPGEIPKWALTEN